MNSSDNSTSGQLLPLLDYSPVWVWVVLFVVIVGALLAFFFLRFFEPNTIEPSNAVTKRQYIRAMDKVFNDTKSGEITYQQAVTEVSSILREYLTRHNPSNPPVNFETMTLKELEAHPEISPNLVSIIGYLYPSVFNATSEVKTFEDFVRFMNAARSVLDLDKSRRGKR